MRAITCVLAVVAGVSAAAVGSGAGAEPASAQLAPLVLEEAGVDGKRRPFARWSPVWPLVNIQVSTRPVRDADGTPAIRYWVHTGYMGSLPPKTSWRGDHPLVPGRYYTSISGDAAFQRSPWTPFERVDVEPRPGEWTGSTSQRHYIRLTRPGPRVLRRIAFSIYGANDGCRASFVLRRQIRIREDGRFYARTRTDTLNEQTQGVVRIRGRVRKRFARGTLRVRRLYEGCGTGLVRWTARRR